MIVLGIASRSGRDFGGGNTQNKNFENAFSGTSGNLANYVESFSYILYSYSGFNHPFYVLNEAETPRKIYPIATSAALALQWLLFVLVNVAYIWVVDLSRLQATTADGYTGPEDMAALFFDSIFGAESPTPKRVMAGLLGLSILGNIIVMTFTAARVKQEIAKQGILPYSLFFASSTKTPWAWLQTYLHPGEKSSDQSPIAALGLHWFSSVFLLAVTASLEPKISYNVLVSLYAYVMDGLMGFIAAGGLLYLKYIPKFRWSIISQFSLGRSRWTNSLPAWIYCLFTGFFLVTSFVPPVAGDAASTSGRAGVPWYVVPVVGLSTPLWGLIWYCGLKVVEWRRGETLEVRREPTIEEFTWSSGRRSEWVMTSELINRDWTTRGHRQDERGIN